MKRIIAVLLAVSMLIGLTGLLSGCAEKKGDTFTVGFDAAFPPYGYQDEAGEYVGFDLDLAAEVCARNGWELVKQPIDWDSKDMEIDSGTIDCIWNGFTINGRENDYTWSVPYVDNSQVFVVSNAAGINDVAGLAGKKIGVQAASSALDALNDPDYATTKATFAAVTEFPDYNTAFMNLEAGAVDAIAMDVGVAKFQLESRLPFKMLAEPLATEQYGVGFKKGNTELKDKVEKTLQEMATDGKFAEIAEKWDLTDSICLGK